MNNGEFIFLSEEAKEKVYAMTEDEITMLASHLAYSMRETQIKVEDERTKILRRLHDGYP